MTITRVGTSQKYADGWAAAFKGKGKSVATKKAAPSKKSKPKKGAKRGKR
jgi:hypothetical protein